MKVRRQLLVVGASLALGALPLATLASSPASATSPNGTIHYMPTLKGSGNGNGNGGGGGHHGPKSSNLYYHGGISDGGSVAIGVETTPKVYLVLWGSQWTNNDPSGEAAILQNFYSNVGKSAWNNTVTQYCQNVAIGSFSCTSGQPAGNPSNLFGGVWSDSTTAAPSHPTQSQLAAEAVKAASHFGNTTAASNATVQYVVATSTGNSMTGFGTSWCAWHSSTTSSYGDIAYTNLPYMTDAGVNCGANFVNGDGVTLGPTAGITIVGGHEFAETETDQFPNGGWLDGSGAEIGDKCAWNSATAVEPFNFVSYPVQPLWSNAAVGGAGGCVQSY